MTEIGPTPGPQPGQKTKCGRTKPPSTWIKKLKICCVPKIPALVRTALHQSTGLPPIVATTAAAVIVGTGYILTLPIHGPLCLATGAAAGTLAAAAACKGPAKNMHWSEKALFALITATAVGLGTSDYLHGPEKVPPSLVQPLEKIGLEQIDAAPERFVDIDDKKSYAILEEVLADIKAWKKDRSHGANITVNFVVAPNGDVVFAVCKNGIRCPCNLDPSKNGPFTGFKAGNINDPPDDNENPLIKAVLETAAEEYKKQRTSTD